MKGHQNNMLNRRTILFSKLKNCLCTQKKVTLMKIFFGLLPKKQNAKSKIQKDAVRLYLRFRNGICYMTKIPSAL